MSTEFAADHAPRWREGVSGQQFGRDFIVLDAEGNTLRGLNGTAIEVWELCDGTRTARALVEQLVQRHGWNVEQVLADTLKFLTELARLGLIDELKEVA
ncbi:PqqD family protein [Myxococcus sp. Y35]|uniref:PqqD family protein n=1 Tax=Pseudomyxococcus flavus TaxID=3115648 RepID=UPI003CE98206